MLFENGAFLPDLPALGNPGSTIAENVYPVARGYSPFGELMYLTTAMDARAIGATSLTAADGSSRVYAFNATKIYSLDGGSLTDRSKSGGYTNTAKFADFAAYGDIAITTNFIDPIQFIGMNSGSLFADLTTAFRAKTVATVRDFLMFGNTTDSTDGDKPERVRRSALGDHTDYTVSASTQADFQDTPGGGVVQRIFGGEYATVFFDHGIYRVTYVGAPAVWIFDSIETDRGLFTPGAAAQNGSTIYYLDSDGFYAFSDKSYPIGNEKVDRWFWSEFDASYADRVSCAIDHDSKCVCWSFPGQGNSGGKPTHVIIFNFELNKWSYAQIDHDIILPLLTSDFTLETLDAFNPDLDDLTLSVDSRVLYQGSALLGLMDGFKLASNQGDPLTAITESSEQQPVTGRRSHITEVWPLNDDATTTIQIGTRNRLQDSVTWTDPMSVNATGFAPVSAEGRYHRVRMNISGNWTDSQGSDVTAKPGGKF